MKKILFYISRFLDAFIEKLGSKPTKTEYFLATLAFAEFLYIILRFNEVAQ